MNTRRNFNLYEITNGQVGESYVRCYAWAESERQAIIGAAAKQRQQVPLDKLSCKLLFRGDFDVPFVTEWSDCGFDDIALNPIAPQCNAATS